MDLLRQREGEVPKGIPISATIGRLQFEDAAKDLLTLTTADVRADVAHRQGEGYANATINRDLAAEDPHRADGRV